MLNQVLLRLGSLLLLTVACSQSPPEAWSLDYSYDDGEKGYSAIVTSDGNYWLQCYLCDDTLVHHGTMAQTSAIQSSIGLACRLPEHEFTRPPSDHASDIAIRRLLISSADAIRPLQFDMTINNPPGSIVRIEQELSRLYEAARFAAVVDTSILFKSKFYHRSAAIDSIRKGIPRAVSEVQ